MLLLLLLHWQVGSNQSCSCNCCFLRESAAAVMAAAAAPAKTSGSVLICNDAVLLLLLLPHTCNLLLEVLSLETAQT
jgi:hypothetical protein